MKLKNSPEIIQYVNEKQLDQDIWFFKEKTGTWDSFIGKIEKISSEDFLMLSKRNKDFTSKQQKLIPVTQAVVRRMKIQWNAKAQ